MAFNLAPVPEYSYGTGIARATTVGDASEQQTVFEGRFAPIGVIESATVAVPGTVTTVELRKQSPEDRVAAPLLDLTEGSWPSGDDVALTEDLAAYLGASVGDEVELGPASVSVTGLVENPTDLADSFVLVADLEPFDIDPDTVATAFLIDAPSFEIQEAHVGSLGIDSGAEGGPDDRTLLALAVLILVVIALAQVALLAGAGFAVVSRRRSRQYGLLAAAGATPRQVERTAATTGLITGLAGSAAGLIVALAVVAPTVPSMEELVNHRIDLALPWWGVVPTVLLAIAATTVAAWWPSRALTRQPVAETLAAGRPPARPVRNTALTGALALVGGTVALLVGVHRGLGFVATLGGVAAFGGALLLAPAVIRLIGSASTSLPLPGRIAGREIARQQGRSAAVVVAIAVALILALSVATASATFDRREADKPGNLPADTAIAWIDVAGGDGGLAVPSAADPAEAEVSVEQTAGARGYEVVPIEVAVTPGGESVTTTFVRSGSAPGLVPEILVTPAPPDANDVFGLGERDEFGAEIVYTPHRLWVATPAMASVLGVEVSPDEAVVVSSLDGAFLLGERNLDSASRTEYRLEPDLPQETSLAASFIAPAAVEENELESLTVGWLLVGDDAISATARNDLAGELDSIAVLEFREPPVSTRGARTSGALFAAALGVVILVAAVSLVRMETAVDLRLLGAVGATGWTLRRVGAASAVLLALAAAVLAVPAGFLAQAAMIAAPDSGFSFAIPWLPLVIIVILFPVLGGIVAVIGPAPVPTGRRPPGAHG